jgi:hypothetical protein
MSSIFAVSWSTSVIFTVLVLFPLFNGVKSGPVDASDERYTMCCRLKRVPEEYMPICSYTPLIVAWRAMQDAGMDLDTVLEEEQRDLIELWGRWNRADTGNRTLLTLVIQCGRPKSVRGMGRCCARHDLLDVCHPLCAEFFDLDADTAAKRKRDMQCYNSGKPQVLKTLIAGYTCLRETSEWASRLSRFLSTQ